MKQSKSLQISSTVSLVFLGAALTVGCTITSSPTDDGSLKPRAPSSTTDGGPAAPGPGTAPSVAAGCGFGEPNGTREQATPIDMNRAYTGLCIKSGALGEDLDFYEVTAPKTDNAGGIVEVQVSNVQNRGLVRIIVTAVADNGVIFDSYTTDEGASVSGWFSVSPGAKYRIQVGRFSGSDEQFAYDLFAKYTAIVDAYEPNNTKEEAKPISVNTPIQATSAAHSPNAKLIDSDTRDWYSVTLAAGTATIKMTNVGADYLCDVQLLDSAGQAAGEKYQTTPGAECVLDATELKAGPYFVKLGPFAGNVSRGEGHQSPPASVVLPYTLEVKQ